MLGANTNKFLALVLIPVLLVAQMLCVCSSHAAQPKAHGEAAASHHHCHATGDEKPSKAPGEPGKHDPSCNHCSQGGYAQAAPDRFELSKSANALLLVIAPTFQDFFANALGREDTRTRSFTDWLSEPYPPPDLLRVKCTLQI